MTESGLGVTEFRFAGKKKKGLIEDKCLKMTIKNLPEGGQGQGVRVRKQEMQRPRQSIKKGRVAGG